MKMTTENEAGGIPAGESEYEENWFITEAMIRYGGGFVKGLGQLYRIADQINQRKLRAAFPEYWIRYSEISEKKQLRETIEAE